jgi:hypothetical protein
LCATGSRLAVGSDGVISSAASRHGFVFADVRSIFVGHQLCSSGTKWLHALDFFDISDVG